MRQDSVYSKYRPKLYRARMPIFWWVHRWEHVQFITRELTSVFVAFYAVVLIVQIRALSGGVEAYENFVAWLRTPTSITLHVIAFAFILFHSFTWFNLAPRAMAVRIGRWRVPDKVIVGLNLIAWVVCSAVMGWFFLTL